MIIKDCHAHSGGKNYSMDNAGYESNIDSYYALLKKDNLEIKESIFFGQPYPYEFLRFYDDHHIPCINYKTINDAVAKECKNYESALFAPIVDERDYNALDELNRCRENYEIRAIKVHSDSVNGRPLMLKDNHLIDFAERHELPIIIHVNNSFYSEFSRLISDNANVNFIIAHLAFLHKDFMFRQENVYYDTSAITHVNFKSNVVFNFIKNDVEPCFFNATKVNYSNISLPSFLKKINGKTEIYKNVELNLERIISSAVKRLGSDHMLSGFDYAWSTPLEQIRIIESSSISESDKENIFYKNFDKLIK